MANGLIRRDATVMNSRILYFRNVPTTLTSYNCNWSQYNVLIFNALWWDNPNNSITVARNYFAGTDGSIRILLNQGDSSGVQYEIYKNTSSSIYIRANKADNQRGIDVIGLV